MSTRYTPEPSPIDYYATALALAKAMGLPLTETFMREHRESITTCFIEAGRAGVRLAPTVPLPPLSAPSAASVNGETPPPSDPAMVASALASTVNGHTPEADGLGCTGGLSPEAPVPLPTMVPTDAGLPCGGVAIADLKPAQLAMLITKVARLVHDQGEAWVPLLGALQSERGKRMERGRKAARPEGPGDGA